MTIEQHLSGPPGLGATHPGMQQGHPGGQASAPHLPRDLWPHIIQQIKEVSAMLNFCKGVVAFPVWAPRKMTVCMDKARCESSLR